MTAAFTIIGTGTRHATMSLHGQQILRGLVAVLDENFQQWRDFEGRRRRVVLRHGQCPYGGVDLILEQLVTGPAHLDTRVFGFTQLLSHYFDWEVERRPAKITSTGKILGPERNRAMCREGANIVVGFPDQYSRGTWNCLKEAALAGIEGRIFPLVV